MRERLCKLIPEFDLIRNPDLRDKALATWEDALERGGWLPADLVRMPFTLTESRPASVVEHVRSVTRVCVEAARVLRETYGATLAIDEDVLVAGALLHDVGRLLELVEHDGRFVKSRSGHLLRHPFSGLSLCYRHGLPDEVCHIVAVHSKEGDFGPRTPEAAILHHADAMHFEALKRQEA